MSINLSDKIDNDLSFIVFWETLGVLVVTLFLVVFFPESTDCRRPKRQILSFKRSKSANLASLIDRVKSDKDGDSKGKTTVTWDPYNLTMSNNLINSLSTFYTTVKFLTQLTCFKTKIQSLIYIAQDIQCTFYEPKFDIWSLCLDNGYIVLWFHLLFYVYCILCNNCFNILFDLSFSTEHQPVGLVFGIPLAKCIANDIDLKKKRSAKNENNDVIIHRREPR